MATHHSTAPELAHYSPDKIQVMQFVDGFRRLDSEKQRELLVLARMLSDKHPEMMDTVAREDLGEITEQQAIQERREICQRNMSYGGES